MTKKILVFTGQPPPAQGVQAIRYGKLIPQLKVFGWDLNFIGPDPVNYSVKCLPDELFDSKVNGHYFKYVGLKRLAPIRRRQTSRIFRPYWFVVQVVAMALERLNLISDFETILKKKMLVEGDSLLRSGSFDAVAGIYPKFDVLMTAYELAIKHKLPFIAIFDDPYGGRTLGGFEPADYKRQKALIDYSSKVIFASDLTRTRYIDAFNILPSRALHINDSFKQVLEDDSSESECDFVVRLSHLGDLAEWRRIEPLLEALVEISDDSKRKISFSQYGFIYKEAENLIKSNKKLAKIVKVEGAVDYLRSHEVALISDILVVVIGELHLDNVPSKFYEYLGAKKPILLLCPRGNPAELLVKKLGIGESSLVTSASEIKAALAKILNSIDSYRDAYDENAVFINKFGVEAVSLEWANAFESVIKNRD